MLKEVVDFLSAFQILPRHVSANGCHLQGVVGTLEATQVMSVLWAYTDYYSSRVTSCGTTYLLSSSKPSLLPVARPAT
jgi:hypothetical protein